MEPWQMNPYIRYMDQRTCSISYKAPIMAYDYRVFAVCRGDCRLEIDGRMLSLNKDSCVIFPPAMPYRFFFSEDNPAVLYDINFNLSFVRSAGIDLSPDTAEEFQTEKMPVPADDVLFAHPLLLDNAQDLCGKIGDLLIEREKRGLYCDERCSARLKTILLEALKMGHGEEEAEDDLTARIKGYLSAHCRESITAEELGRLFGYHPFYLNRIFAGKTGCTMHRYLLECRMERACSMLTSTHLSVREISESLGFSAPAYFSELFRKMRGMTPGEYRQKS